MASLRGTIGGEKVAVKLRAETKRRGSLRDRVRAKSRLLSLRALWSPIVGRKRYTPKARGWIIKLDTDPAFVILSFANDHNGTSNFFTGFHISEPKVVTVRNHLLQQDKRAMGVDDLSYGFLGKGKTGNLLTQHDDPHGQEQPLAAAYGGGPTSFCWQRIQDVTLLLKEYRREEEGALVAAGRFSSELTVAIGTYTKVRDFSARMAR